MIHTTPNKMNRKKKKQNTLLLFLPEMRKIRGRNRKQQATFFKPGLVLCSPLRLRQRTLGREEWVVEDVQVLKRCTWP